MIRALHPIGKMVYHFREFTAAFEGELGERLPCRLFAATPMQFISDRARRAQVRAGRYRHHPETPGCSVMGARKIALGMAEHVAGDRT